MARHLGASCITACTSVVHVLLSVLVKGLCAEGLEAHLAGDDVEVCGLCLDASAAEADDLYVCAGLAERAADQLAQAVERGAAAYLCEERAESLAEAAPGVPAIVVDDVERAAACMAPLFRRA